MTSITNLRHVVGKEAFDRTYFIAFDNCFWLIWLERTVYKKITGWFIFITVIGLIDFVI